MKFTIGKDGTQIDGKTYNGGDLWEPPAGLQPRRIRIMIEQKIIYPPEEMAGQSPRQLVGEADEKGALTAPPPPAEKKPASASRAAGLAKARAAKAQKAAAAKAAAEQPEPTPADDPAPAPEQEPVPDPPASEPAAESLNV
jgi:hypothetical protein